MMSRTDGAFARMEGRGVTGSLRPSPARAPAPTETDLALARTAASDVLAKGDKDLQPVLGKSRDRAPPNGTAGQFSISLSPMRDDKGGINSIVVVMTDVTDAAVLQAKLMHTEKMAAVGQLVSGVAHEVNNPLAAILGFTDLLLENPEVPAGAKEELRVILQEAQRTKLIIQNLLSFARQKPASASRCTSTRCCGRRCKLRAYDFSKPRGGSSGRFRRGPAARSGRRPSVQQVFLNIREQCL